MFKFIHIADVHLDTSFYSNNKELRRILRNSLREGFIRVIDACINERVHALLIAGDFFDDDLLTFQTESIILEGINRLKDNSIHVYYSTGNHDPGDVSYRANLIKWPSNFHLIGGDRVEVFDVLDSDEMEVGRIISVGHQSKAEGRNLITKFPVKEGHLPHVGLVHTMVTTARGVENHDRYLPCRLEDLKEKNYDYWALGHIHQRQQIADSPIYYSGNLQGRHPKETGEKGGNLVEIDNDGRVSVRFIKFSAIRWETLVIKGLEAITTYEALKDYIYNGIDKFIEEAGVTNREVIFRLELTGRCYLKRVIEEEDSRNQLQEDIKRSFGFIEVEIKSNGLLNAISLDDYREGNHVLSKALSMIKNIDEDKRLLENLSKIKLVKKGINTQADREAYIKELMKDLDEEILSRMVGGEE